jgi:uncharacterized protein (DUF2235 family)
MSPPPNTLFRDFASKVKSMLRLHTAPVAPAPKSGRKSRNHVLVIDGTQSRVLDGQETNAGLLYKLLREALDPRETTLWYHPGIQGHGFWNAVTIASGWGINQAIFDGYAQLAANYVPGDRVFLFGFSRGAYAVRSISGMIGAVGLVRNTNATKSNLRFAFRLYESKAAPAACRTFKSIHCHSEICVEMIGVFDTVKALGLNYPLLTYLAPMATEFHTTNIGASVRSGYHALARDEDRTAFCPVMWDAEPGWTGQLEQVWFRGSHADIGGHVWQTPQARPLSNIPLVWMAEKAEKHGLSLPPNWKSRFPQDPNAPAVGSRDGIGKFFLLRAPRVIGKKTGEYLHSSTDATLVPALHVVAAPGHNA